LGFSKTPSPALRPWDQPPIQRVPDWAWSSKLTSIWYRNYS